MIHRDKVLGSTAAWSLTLALNSCFARHSTQTFGPISKLVCFKWHSLQMNQNN
jgi:hypothetical protein